MRPTNYDERSALFEIAGVAEGPAVEQVNREARCRGPGRGDIRVRRPEQPANNQSDSEHSDEGQAELQAWPG